MANAELFVEYTEEKIKARREPTLTANTSGQTYARPTSDQFGMELIRLMQKSINNMGRE